MIDADIDNDTSTSPVTFTLPNYLMAADNHNIANGNVSWLSPSSWKQKLGNVGSYIATATLAGANSFYNTGATIGRFFGTATPDRNTADWITSFDDDFGKYYRENQASVELGGFILGSILPGMAGVSALRAGQAALGGAKIFNAGNIAFKTALMEGKVGSGLGRATGLLVDRTDEFLTAAASQINSSTTAIKLLNANTTKALAAGFWQNTLEAAAFETMVQTTMFRSPILEQQDVSDIISNVALGGAVGGVIGGAFGAAKLRGRLKTAMLGEDEARNPFIQRYQPLKATPTSDAAIQYAADVELAAVPVPVRNADGTIINNFDAMKSFYDDRVTKSWGGFRESTLELAGKDIELGNVIANYHMPVVGTDGIPMAGAAQNIFNNYSGVRQILRPFEKSALEEAMAKAVKAGKVPKMEVASRWVKLFGEDAGRGFDKAPLVATLGDMYSGEKAVLGAVRREGFKPPKVGVETWSVLKLAGDTAHLKSEARYIWASKLLKEIPDGAVIGRYDFPLLQRAYKDAKTGIKVVSDDGLEITDIVSKQQLFDLIKDAKEEAALELRLASTSKAKGAVRAEIADEAIPRIVDVRRSYWEVGPSGNLEDDLFAMQGDFDRYLADMNARKRSLKTTEMKDPAFLPKYAKFVYEVPENLVATTPHILDAMVHFAEQHRMFQEGAKRVTAKILGPTAEQLPDISARSLETVSRVNTGAGVFTSDAARYGSLGSDTSTIGAITRELETTRAKQLTEAIAPSLTKLGGKVEAAFEFEAFNQKVSRSGQLWIEYAEETAEGTVNYMVTKRAAKLALDPETGVLDFDEISSVTALADIYRVKNTETAELIREHIRQTGARTSGHNEIAAQLGKTSNRDPKVFRPIRPNLRDYQHFAFVRDETVTGAGHMTMLHAASEKELQQLIDKVPPRYKVLTKTDVEKNKQYRGEYEYSRTLNENYIDSDLKNNGVFSNFFPKSDPQKIIDDVLQQHIRESNLLVKEAIRLRYEAPFAALEDMGRQYSKVESSRFASRSDLLENVSQNPFLNQIKTALNITKANEYPLLYSFNTQLDTAVSKAYSAIRDSFIGTKSPADLERVNAELDRYGMKPAYYDAALHALANHSAPKGELTKFVRQANALLSQFTLGLDPLNALNNAIGSTMLRGTELKLITRAIAEGNTALAGDLAKLAKVATPGAPGEILSPTKLASNAISNYWKKDSRELAMAKYRDMGLIKSRADQLQMLVDDITLHGTESVSDLTRKMDTAYARAKSMIGDTLEKGEKLTQNVRAEEFNRFISANVMDQITSVAIKHGLMDDATARTYIRTFVNRVEGNIIASQRPLIFQGPIGQAVSLFQSYQFNLLQQLFRYVGEGRGKDLAMLAGLQSTLYGLQSMPAFQFMNVHIIGQMSGNTEHRDTYDAVYGTVGRTAGDWILYGIPSNILQTNIYSRGDINPRHLTILPTTLQEIPLVQGWGKFLGSMYETSKRIAGGGAVWESLLQGVEHNGISRPLAGFAQTLQALGPDGQVYSTSSKGTILYQNDLMSLATLTRLAGGRPIDEAVVNDSMYRVKAYEAARRKDMAGLTETIKGTLIQGNQPSEEQIMQFAKQYAELGGKQKGFNKWMMDLYRSANTSQAEQIQGSLSNPFSYKVQLLMGGDE